MATITSDIQLAVHANTGAVVDSSSGYVSSTQNSKKIGSMLFWNIPERDHRTSNPMWKGSLKDPTRGVEDDEKEEEEEVEESDAGPSWTADPLPPPSNRSRRTVAVREITSMTCSAMHTLLNRFVLSTYLPMHGAANVPSIRLAKPSQPESCSEIPNGFITCGRTVANAHTSPTTMPQSIFKRRKFGCVHIRRAPSTIGLTAIRSNFHRKRHGSSSFTELLSLCP
mmetsp:Transcript_32796/g.38041  ORF Transcript_32796/g.38041 Transcript_32796/m.38041 type:complete len:225 (+) Transcript_32796:254-928(+)